MNVEDGEQLKKEKSFELTPLAPDLSPVLAAPKFTTDAPFFYASKRKEDLAKDIRYEGTDPHGNPYRWYVTPNRSERIGAPGIFAEHVWDNLITPIIEAYLDSEGRIPEILPLGGIRKCLRIIGRSEGGWEARELLRSLMQIGQASCDFDFFLPSTSPTGETSFRRIKAIFARFSIWQIGSKHLSEEEVKSGNITFDFDLDDTVYLQLHTIERAIQQSDERRYMDRQYMYSVSPTGRRWYKLMHHKIFGVVNNKGTHCEISYSWYLKHHHTLGRQTERYRIVEQMNKVVRDHIASGYLNRIEYRKIKEPGKEIDFLIRYYPGPQARESINRVLRGFNSKRRLPQAAPRPRKKRELIESAGTEVLVASGDAPVFTTEASPVESLPETPEKIISPEVIQLVSERGVMGAEGILKKLSPKLLDRVPDVIEYFDEERTQGRAIMPNPAGWLINLIRSTEDLPASFEPRRIREERERAARRLHELETLKDLINEHYDSYWKKTVDEYIAATLSPEEYTQRLEEEKRILVAQGTLKFIWEKHPATLERDARKELRDRLAEQSAVMSPEEFYHTEVERIHESGFELSDLGIGTSQIEMENIDENQVISSTPNDTVSTESPD